MKKSERTGILVGIALAFLATRSVLAEKNTDPPASLQELKESITEIMYRHNVHAVGIAMLDGNGPVWIGALGKANLENHVDADENSLFRIASTSKMFVALSKGFIIVETDDPKALFRWTSEWADVIDFQIEPVLRDEEAGPILKEMM